MADIRKLRSDKCVCGIGRKLKRDKINRGIMYRNHKQENLGFFLLQFYSKKFFERIAFEKAK